MLLILSVVEKITVIQDQETWILLTALTGISMDSGLSFLVWKVMWDIGQSSSSLPFCD